MHIQGLRRQKTVLLGEVDELKQEIAQGKYYSTLLKLLKHSIS